MLNCIIVEDEPLAAEILENYISKISFLQLKAKVTDALFAFELVLTEKIDVIFLDIHLPHLKGLDFIKTLQQRPQIIFTTAYREYAIDAFELNAVDYLLKPIHYSRFLAAINKLNMNVSKPPEEALPVSEKAFIFINHNKKNVKINLGDILYVESKREYINIVTTSQEYLVKHTLSAFEKLLETSDDFIRVHRSFIVAKHRIKAYSLNEIEVDDKTIPIGRYFKDEVMQVFQKFLA